MDRLAFKLRMQALKVYRELNPGKTYLDFKLYAEGGEIPPEPIPYKGKLYTDRYGKKYTEQLVADYYENNTDEIDRFSGTPMVKGLKPLADARDAVDFTPMGDAVAAYEAYDAAKQGDWTGAALAAATMIPFVPQSVRQFRRNYKGVTPKNVGNRVANREVPRVNKNITTNQLDNIAANEADYLAKRNKAANQSFNVFERLMDDPEYLKRAELVKRQFGDDYTTVYADIINAYNTDPVLLPKITRIADDSDAAGRMYRDANGQYNYGINPRRTRLGNNITEHELSHYTDMLKAGDAISADANNNMLYQMSKDIINGVDDKDWYFTRPTELKAHMNQLREYMYNKGYISRRGEVVSSKMMKSILDDISKVDSMKEIARASKLFNSTYKFTKWFNSIPLLGVGAAAMYDNKENSK